MWESESYLEYYNQRFLSIINSNTGSQNLSLLRKLHNSVKLSFSPLKSFQKVFEGETEITILDIGGGGGDNYLSFTNLFSNIQYVVKDSKYIWNFSRHHRKKIRRSQDKILHYDSVSDNLRPKIVVIIGTISFIQGFDIQSHVLNGKIAPEYIYIDRTFFQYKSQNFIQLAKLEGANNICFAEINHYSQSRHELIKAFDDSGYFVAGKGFPFPWAIRKKTGIALGFYQELLFAKKFHYSSDK